MKNFTQYYKENYEINESFLGNSLNILGFSSAAIGIAFCTILIANAFNKNPNKESKIQNFLHKSKEFISGDYVLHKYGLTDVNKILEKEKSKTSVEFQMNKMKQQEYKFMDELKEVFKAISEKNFDLAHEEYMKLGNFALASDVERVIVLKVVESLGEEPTFSNGRGNNTFGALKKIFGQAKAKAYADLSKMTFDKIVKESSVSTTPAPQQTDEKEEVE